MNKLILIFSFTLSLTALSSPSQAAQSPPVAPAVTTTGQEASTDASLARHYGADVFDLDGKNLLFRIQLTRTQKGNELLINSKFIDAQTNADALLEEAHVNAETSDFSQYSAKNLQTDESGHITVTGDKVKMEYQIKDKQSSKEISKPKFLIAPANFEPWLEKNFATLKEKKSMSVDFLIWDRMETFSFKVSYLGEQDLDGQKTQAFKMNIDNFLIAAFISPIRIWYSQDMSHILRFKGRVAVKKKNKDGSFGDLDADVRYKYN